jgi:competence protein ComEA
MMTNSPVLQHNARNALAVWDILSFKRRSVLAVLSLVCLLGVAMLAGVSPSHAEPTAAQSSAAQGSTAAQKAASAAPASTVARVNINTADAQTLSAGLHGVGEARAAEIVRYRETYGPFSSAEELVEVKGIGQSTLDKNRDVIILE